MPSNTLATVPAAAPATADPIATTTAHQTATRYRERAAYIRAVAAAFEADRDPATRKTTDLIVAALVTAAEDAEGMAATLDHDERRIA